MLIEAMRKQAETWWFRAFLLLLACLFIYQWGFHGMITGSGTTSRNLASVGGTKINVNQFARELSREISRIKINFKSDLSEQQQKQLYPYVLENMINNLLLEREADRLGLRVTDDQIRYVISENKDFKTSEGTFDQNLFNNYLTNIQMSEKDFIDMIRKELRRNMLMKTLGGGINSSQILTTRLYSYEHQRRLLQVVAIESHQLKLAKDPTEPEILDYYNKNPAKFTAPEYRDITALILTRALTLKDVKIDENQLKDYFDRHEDEFKDRKFDQVKDDIKKELEKRDANEKLFTLTNKIDDALAGGASLEEIAKNYSIEVTSFSHVSAEGTYDPQHKANDSVDASVSDPLQLRLISEAFNEKENDSSKVIEYSEGKFFVSHINKIYRAHPLTYEESQKNAKDFLIQDLKSEQAKKIAQEFESVVNQGGLLTNAAQERGLKTTQVRVTRKGPLGPSAVYLPDNFIENLYHVKVGGAKASSYLNDDNQQDYIVGYVEKVEPLETPIPEDRIKEYKDQVQGELFNDLFVQYVTSLRKIFPVEYNNKVLEGLAK
ncbi:MAG: SurA N-terminal domain-containing protein [Janthinobacterium lividum]